MKERAEEVVRLLHKFEGWQGRSQSCWRGGEIHEGGNFELGGWCMAFRGRLMLLELEDDIILNIWWKS